MQEKKVLSFPIWVETIVVIVLLIMAVAEWNSSQWFFAAIFGITGIGVGISIIARLVGDKHGKA